MTGESQPCEFLRRTRYYLHMFVKLIVNGNCETIRLFWYAEPGFERRSIEIDYKLYTADVSARNNPTRGSSTLPPDDVIVR